jgi:hypothetical protein
MVYGIFIYEIKKAGRAKSYWESREEVTSIIVLRAICADIKSRGDK